MTRARRLMNTTLLAGLAVFTSEGYKTEYYNHFRGKIYSDVAGSLAIQQSDDNVTFDTLTTLAVSAATPAKFDEICYAEYIRFVYTNGASDQTVFRISACGDPFK